MFSKLKILKPSLFTHQIHIKMIAKGRIISKGLLGILEFSQKMNERILCSMY